MRHAQSGFLFGFGLVGSLIGVVVMIAIAVAAFAYVNNLLMHHYVDPEKATWDAEKAVLVTDKNTCVAANKTLQADVDKLFIEVEKQNKAVELQAAETARIRAYRAARKPADDLRLAQIATDKFNLITSLGKPDGGISCEQMDAALLETAKQHMRDYGPMGNSPPLEPSPGALRVVPEQPERPKAVNPLRVVK